MDELKIKVDYYDKKHMSKFKKNPDYYLFNAISSKLIDITRVEFNTYFIFTEQHDREGFRSFSELKERFNTRIGLLDHLDLSRGTIEAKTPYKSVPNDIRERVGVSASLCLANKIYNLTEADWEGIPETNFSKTLDFNICSDGQKYIYVESKGAAVEDNSKKSSSISKHKKSIEDKKATSKSTSNNIYFGVITAIDNGVNKYAQSWLLDPEAPSIDMDPYKFKLLSRLYYYQRNLLSILGVRSTLIIALTNRINIISILEDYMPVNHTPLYKGNGSALEFNINSYSSKSQLTSKGVIGKLYPVDGDRVLFIGFTEDIFNLVIAQDFENINNYKSKEMVIEDILICRIGQKEQENFKELNLDFDKYKQKNKEYVEFRLNGTFNFTTSGRVYSIIDINQLDNNIYYEW